MEKYFGKPAPCSHIFGLETNLQKVSGPYLTKRGLEICAVQDLSGFMYTEEVGLLLGPVSVSSELNIFGAILIKFYCCDEIP